MIIFAAWFVRIVRFLFCPPHPQEIVYLCAKI